MPHRDYAFRDLVANSGASRNEMVNWVQRRVISPGVGDTAGTGVHRRFDFFNNLEACVAEKLNRLPGGMPSRELTLALDAIRQAAYPALDPGDRWQRVRDQLAVLSADEEHEAHQLSMLLAIAPLGRQYFFDFLDPATRDREAQFWLVWSPRLGFGFVVDSRGMLDALLADIDCVVVVNLHNLVTELERKTGDHWVPRPIVRAADSARTHTRRKRTRE